MGTVGSAVVLAAITISCSGAAPAAIGSATVPPTNAAPSQTLPATPSATAAAAPRLAAVAGAPWRIATPPPEPSSGAGAPEATQWIAVDTFDQQRILAAVYLPAQPAAARVVYLHGDGGLTTADLAFAASLAKDGALVVAPCWQGPLSRNPLANGCTNEAPLRTKAADVVKDVSAIADAARTLPWARSDRVVVIGHSGGAAASLLAASLGGHIQAVVAIASPYPSEAEGTAGLRARWGAAPTEHAGDLAVPVLLLHGTADLLAPSTSIDRARAFEKVARDQGKKIDAIYVEGGGHFFIFRQQELFTADMRARLLAFVTG